MANKGLGNFAFLYGINKDLYKALYKAEKYARIDIFESGHELRKALEFFIKQVASDHNLTDYLKRGKETGLFACIERMNDVTAMRMAGFLKSNQTFQNKPLLPPCPSISYTKNNGAPGNANVYNLIRMVGNAGAHTDLSPSDPKMDFETICKVFKGTHTMLKTYFSNRLDNTPPKYEKNLMPIDDFVVTRAYAPSDRNRSLCRMEFVAHTVDSDGEPEFHALLRLYERRDLDSTFMLRNRECFVEASKVSLSSVPDGMTRLRELTKRENTDNEFYIIAYIFNRPAQPLNNAVLAQMTPAQRLELCARLVQCMDTLHNSATHIYHRLLNHECIYVSRLENIWVPYIIKLDYAKISIDNKGTVIVHAAAANAILQEMVLNKFIPPEWQSKDSDATDIDWAKVDVFSLGILLAEILYGRLGTPLRITSQDLEELEELELSDAVLDMLDCMQADSPNDRPTIRQVRELFTQEVM